MMQWSNFGHMWFIFNVVSPAVRIAALGEALIRILENKNVLIIIIIIIGPILLPSSVFFFMLGEQKWCQIRRIWGGGGSTSSKPR